MTTISPSVVSGGVANKAASVTMLINLSTGPFANLSKTAKRSLLTALLDALEILGASVNASAIAQINSLLVSL